LFSGSADPRTVIELIETVARAHPRVLKEPSPLGLFVGYGDSSINFELRAWTGEFGTWFQTRSDLAVAVYDAVQEAGMAFPFPQRDVHLVEKK
jgi:potassium-dependent mechanosensitive channel